MSNEAKDLFLSLIRIGAGQELLDTHLIAKENLQENWCELKILAERHGLSALIADGLDRLPQEDHLPKPLMLQLIGTVLQNYEYRYELYRRAIAELAAFYNSHGFKMMVLKGYACALDWPKPEHRPSGDIDIWQFGKWKEADKAISYEMKINVEWHLHHTVFYWRDFMVENHYDFINVHHHKSHQELETVLKNLGNDENYFIDIYEERVYLPAPNLHALFLMKHLSMHFVSGESTFRQVLDWAFFVVNHGKDVDWVWLLGLLDKFGMKPIYLIINAICVEDLGFSSACFHGIESDKILKNRVLDEILMPAEYGNRPTGLSRRIIWRFRRWKASEWKHKLCYKESMWGAFWSGVWNHLLKPSSI